MLTHKIPFKDLSREDKNWIKNHNHGKLPEHIIYVYDQNTNHGIIYPDSITNTPYVQDDPQIVFPKPVHELLIENT